MNELTVIIPQEQEEITASAEEKTDEVSLMIPNQNGATFIPAVSADGVISWTNDQDLPNPAPVNIKGDKGDTGATGLQGPKGDIGPKGDKGDTGATGPQGIQGQKGDKGDKGDTGAQGIQGPKGEKGDDGAPGNNGKDGIDGKDGKDGRTPVAGVDYFTEADKAEMVSAVIAALPLYDGEVIPV